MALRPSWINQRVQKFPGIFFGEERWVRKERGMAEEWPTREEALVSSKEEHVTDELLWRKTLLLGSVCASLRQDF